MDDYVKREQNQDSENDVHGPVSSAPKRSAANHGGARVNRPRVAQAPPPDDDDDDDDDSDDDSSPPPPRRAPGRGGSARGSPLPMPHNGAPPPEAGEDGDESVVHVYSPMWSTVFRKIGRRPVDETQCWGCRRGALNISALPYEGYTRLARDLPKQVVEHGLYAAANWAGTYYREEVLANIIADEETLAKSQWDGLSIVWHFFKHTHLAVFRALGEQLELEFACDMLMTERLYQMPQFGNPDKDVTVDPATIKVLAPLRSMLDRQRKVDPRKNTDYTSHGRGTSGKADVASFAKDRFTGRGLLHQ